jgi:hypothetical protein
MQQHFDTVNNKLAANVANAEVLAFPRNSWICGLLHRKPLINQQNLKFGPHHRSYGSPCSASTHRKKRHRTRNSTDSGQQALVWQAHP